jgi:hypothetical protein
LRPQLLCTPQHHRAPRNQLTCTPPWLAAVEAVEDAEGAEAEAEVEVEVEAAQRQRRRLLVNLSVGNMTGREWTDKV